MERGREGYNVNKGENGENNERERWGEGENVDTRENGETGENNEARDK